MSSTATVSINQKTEFFLPQEFPIRIYETNLALKPNGFNAWHWHDELQLCIVRTGAVSITVCDKNFILYPGEGIFINQGQLHMTRSIDTEPAKYSCINISPNFLAFFHGSILEQKYLIPFQNGEVLSAVTLKEDIAWQKEVLDHTEQIIHFIHANSYGYELEVYLQIMQIWKKIVLHTSCDVSDVSTFNNREIKKILSFLHSHYMDNITLDKVAEAAHHSKSYCCRLFKYAINCTIWEYLTEYRIQKSLPLLCDDSLNITEIAYAVGFSGASYFIKQFRKTMHMTPKSYRNSLHITIDGFSAPSSSRKQRQQSSD